MRCKKFLLIFVACKDAQLNLYHSHRHEVEEKNVLVLSFVLKGKKMVLAQHPPSVNELHRNNTLKCRLRLICMHRCRKFQIAGGHRKTKCST